MTRLFPVAALLLALAACSSTPSVHYTLTPPANSSLAVGSAAGSGNAGSGNAGSGNPSTAQSSVSTTGLKPYALTSVTVPAESDQTAIVVRQEDGRMLVLEFDRWIADLSSHLQSAVSVDMTSQLGMPPVQNLGTASLDKSFTRIQLDVQRFDMVPGRQVSLSAVWRIQYGAPAATLICHAEMQQPVDPGVSAMVVGQQKNIRQLSALMSQTLVARKAVAGAKCSSI